MRRRVVITGMGVVSPVGNDIPSFWESVRFGRSGIRHIDRFDTEGMPSQIAGMADDVCPKGMGNKDIHRLDRYSVFAIEAADQAWAQSGLAEGNFDPARSGVILGTGIGGIETVASEQTRLIDGGPRRVSPLLLPKGLANMASGNLAIRFGLRGPNKAVITACASGAHAIGDAADLIRFGRADLMVAGGTETPIIPLTMAGFGNIRALSSRNEDPQRASRPFDKDRDGFVISEGAGILILESEEHAMARGAVILGEVAGYGETCDAFHITAPTADGAGAAAAMNEALRDADMVPGDVQYFNAHGTSTPLNDPAETRALKTVFGDFMPLVSSTKSVMGHLMGAAGAVEAIVCVKALETGIAPPNINYDTPDPECDVNIVANVAREVALDAVMSNSLGFGGHNAALIFRRYN